MFSILDARAAALVVDAQLVQEGVRDEEQAARAALHGQPRRRRHEVRPAAARVVAAGGSFPHTVIHHAARAAMLPPARAVKGPVDDGVVERALALAAVVRGPARLAADADGAVGVPRGEGVLAAGAQVPGLQEKS